MNSRAVDNQPAALISFKQMETVMTNNPRKPAAGTTDERPRWEGPPENRPRGYLPAEDDPNSDRDAAGENNSDPDRNSMSGIEQKPTQKK